MQTTNILGEINAHWPPSTGGHKTRPYRGGVRYSACGNSCTESVDGGANHGDAGKRHPLKLLCLQGMLAQTHLFLFLTLNILLADVAGWRNAKLAAESM